MKDKWIVDPSVLIKSSINQPETPHVDTLLMRLGEPHLDEIHIPEFCLIECTNVLWKYVRFANVIPQQAGQQLSILKQLPLTIHHSAMYLPRALEIGINHQLAIYDSIYLALAEKLTFPLITLDAKQANAALQMGLSIKPLTDFPEYHA